MRNENAKNENAKNEISETLKQIRAIDINLHHREFDRKLEQVFTAVGCRANRTMPYDNLIQICKAAMAADPNETQRLRMMISQFRVSELTVSTEIII